MATIDAFHPASRRPWHALHNLLAAYPVALFTAALATDIAYVNTAEPMWSNFSVWLITGGLIMGGLAALFGIIDAIANRGVERARAGTLHIIGTLLVLGLGLLNAFVHSRDGWTAVMPTGIMLSGIVAVLAIITSLLGSTVVVPRREYDT